MIIKLTSTPSNTEYIQAFRDGDNHLIDRFLREQYGRFMGTIKKKFTIKIEGAYEEIYQGATVRLWEKINQDNTFELFGDLANYMIGIGINVAQEYIREHKGLIRQIKQNEDDREDGLDQFIDMETTGDNIDMSFKPLTITPAEVWEEINWIESVENPYIEYVRHNHTPEECIDEWTRLVEQFEKGQHIKSPLSKKTAVEDYRVEIIRHVVDNMGKPCAPLLLEFYGNEKKSWEIIANELKYSGADSAKTQKNKCMGKLKKIVETQMKSYKL